MKEGNNIILYQDDNEITRVSVRFADEDVWLTQNQLAEIYDTTQQNIALHIKNIYADRELSDDESTHKDFLLVRQEGNRQVQRNIVHYNLDMIIALGYRVQSKAEKTTTTRAQTAPIMRRRKIATRKIGVNNMEICALRPN